MRLGAHLIADGSMGQGYTAHTHSQESWAGQGSAATGHGTQTVTPRGAYQAHTKSPH